GKLHRQQITLGERDERRGEYVVNAGLKAGDAVLRNPSRTLVEGNPVQEKAASAAKPASTATVATAK
ncbi:MAG TPA: efflux transporter periplasmic adaptor subunit, partial [Burkholderiaceae bacterium]